MTTNKISAGHTGRQRHSPIEITRRPGARASGAALGRVLIPVLAYVGYSIFAQNPWMVLITFPAFAAIIYFSWIEKGKFINEKDVINFMSFVFFVISPIQSINEFGQFTADVYVSGIRISYHNLITAELIFLLVYFPYMMLMRRWDKPSVDIYVSVGAIHATWIFVALCVAFLAHIVAYGGVENMLSARRLRDFDSVSGFAAVWKGMLVALTGILFAAAFNRQRRSSYKFLLAISSAVLLIISVNPLNIARYMVLGAWAPIVIIIFYGRIKPLHLHLFVVLSLFIFMPIFDYTSRSGETLSSAVYLFGGDIQDTLRAPLSDVYAMAVSAAWWFESSSYFYGQKTLGLLLFFVPRSFWVGKPTLTGLDIGDFLEAKQYAGTANLSFFVGGDFYADFGLVGVFLGVPLLALVVRLGIYRTRILVHGWNLKILFFIGALPILLRGPLGANIGFFLVILIVYSAVCRLLPHDTRPHVP